MKLPHIATIHEADIYAENHGKPFLLIEGRGKAWYLFGHRVFAMGWKGER